MKKKLIYALLIIALTSCNKQELKLPRVHTQAVNKVYNNSAVWIFYTIKNKDTLAELNRNNSIQTTNWLFNIDRRLTLKQIYKPFRRLLEKRQKKSIHHVDGMKNYFSISDSIAKKVKFLPFNLKTVTYALPNLKDSLTLNVKFYKTNFILNDTTFLYPKLDWVITQKMKNNLYLKQIKFYYQDNLSFEKYVFIKSKLNQLSLKKRLQTTNDYYFK